MRTLYTARLNLNYAVMLNYKKLTMRSVQQRRKLSTDRGYIFLVIVNPNVKLLF